MTEASPTVTVDRSGYFLLRREAAINNRPLLRHLLSLAKFLGIGALVHAWFLGPVFDSNNLWSYGYLLAWPIPLLGWIIAAVSVWVLYAFILIVACATIWWVGLSTYEWNERRQRRLTREVNQGVRPPTGRWGR